MQQIVIERIFEAPVEKVWQAWTNPEMIKKWWGPKDFTAPFASVDFKVGGKYIYCMHGPEGSEWDKDMYSAGVFKEIIPMEKIVVSDYFSDDLGNKISPTDVGQDENMPDEMDVEVRFEKVDENHTKLSIIYTPQTESQYNGMKESGMEEGWSTSLDKLASSLKDEMTA